MKWTSFIEVRLIGKYSSACWAEWLQFRLSAPQERTLAFRASHLHGLMPDSSLISLSAFIVVLPLSQVWFFVTPWAEAHQAFLSITISCSLVKLWFIESVMPSNHLILCHPLLLCLQSFPASGSFLMSWLFTSGVQSIGASASASVLPWIFRVDFL